MPDVLAALALPVLAADEAPAGSPLGSMLFPILIVFLIFYFLVLRPGSRDRKARDLDALVRRLVLAGETRTARDRSRLAALDRTHQTLGYRETLKRGYAVVRGDGEVVMTRAAAEQAAALEIEFSDGRLALDETARPAAKKAKPKPPSPEQGSLF